MQSAVWHARSSAHIDTLVVDRQPLFLDALGSLLAAPPLSARVQTCSRSDVALDLVRAGGIDLLFCELHSVPMNGLDLARTIAGEVSGPPLILLGDETDKPALVAALATKVAGIFSKSAALDEVLAGVEAVLAGHRAIGSGLVDQLLEELTTRHPRNQSHDGAQLSPTELEILAMIGQAHSIPAIAASRGISKKTVRNHLAKIYRKLELHGRTEAMLQAVRMGLTVP